MNIDSLWDYSDPSGSKEKFISLLRKKEQEHDVSAVAEITTQIARCEGLEMKFEEAHLTLDNVLELLTDEMHKPRARYFLERGRVFNSSGDKKQAEEFFIKAINYSEDSQLDYFAVDAAHMMGVLLVGQNRPDEKLEWELKALKLAEGSNDSNAQKWLGSLYNNIGWSYYDLGKFDEAIEQFGKSEAFRIAQGDEARAKIARWCIARMFRAKGMLEKALDLQFDLLKSDENHDSSGFGYEEIAECLHGMNRVEESQHYFKFAYDILSQDKWFVRNESERLHRLKSLSL